MTELCISLMQKFAAELRESAPVLSEHEIALLAWDRAGLGTLTCADPLFVPPQRGQHCAADASADLAPAVAAQRG